MLFSFAVLALSVLSAVHALVQVGRHIPLTRVRTLQRLGPAHFLENDLSDGLVTNVRNFAYLVHVRFSIGRQEFSMSFDTGSSDLWIVSSNCTNPDCQGVPKYNENFQTSLSVTERPFELTYLLGSVSGKISYETVTLGSYEISSQVFALANRTTSLQLSGTGNSGVLGLAFPSTAAIPATSGKTILENILSHFNESDRFFAFHLSRDQVENPSSDDAGSSFTIAQLDPAITKDTNAFAYTPVSQFRGTYDYWKLPLQGLTLNSVPLPLSLSLVPGAQTPIAVLDTGTTMVLGPSVDVTAFWGAVGGNVTRKNPASDMWEVRCDRGVDVKLILGEKNDGREYAVHPADINMEEGGNLLDGWCLGGIQANDSVNSGDWLLGDVFLRNVYVTHHSATSTEPPLIGLFSMTDQKLASAEFRNDRGPDLAANSTVQFQRVSIHSQPSQATVCALFCVGGFVGGGVVTLLLIRRRFKND